MILFLVGGVIELLLSIFFEIFPVSSNCGQSVIPLLPGNFVNNFDAEDNVIPISNLNISEITASFSIGSNEHVEYTILPPGLVRLTALINNSNCNLCNIFPPDGSHFFQTSGFFLVVAEPVQGASTSILSNPDSGTLGINLPSWCTIIGVIEPCLLVLATRVFILLLAISFAMTIPLPSKCSAI